MKRAVPLMHRRWVTDTSETLSRPASRRTALVALITGMAWIGLQGSLVDANASEKPAEDSGGDGPAYVKIDWFLVQAKQDDGRAAQYIDAADP